MDESLPTFVGDPVAESTFAFAADNDARGPLLQVSVSHFFYSRKYKSAIFTDAHV